MQNSCKSLTFIESSLANSDAFANEIQKVYKTSTYSFHSEMNNQNIFYGGKAFYLFTSLW